MHCILKFVVFYEMVNAALWGISGFVWMQVNESCKLVLLINLRGQNLIELWGRGNLKSNIVLYKEAVGFPIVKLNYALFGKWDF